MNIKASSAPESTIKKIVVAVHGIGDQLRNETILATAVRFCDYFGYPGMVPLGAFSGVLQTGADGKRMPAYAVETPPTCGGLAGEIGFAEVYWADVARREDTDGYNLQETKAWAKSVVNRVRVLATEKDPANADLDFPRIRLVLEEMIEAISVFESLLFLSQKAGVFDFNLKKMLDAFLGDVQQVADFPPIRAAILAKFHEALDAIGELYPGAEIYIVSHSEGTVVAWLGLLEACDAPAAHSWINRVRGFMTLGSPIDKHLILWPGLFEKFKGPPVRPGAGFPFGDDGARDGEYIAPAPEANGWVTTNARAVLRSAGARQEPWIRWVNYVDYADPVGFNLDTARRWLQARGYDQVFRFHDADDFSFRRYPVPGEAHVEYWNDAEVFGHFIRTVVAPPPHPVPAAELAELALGPPSIKWVPLVSYGVAYMIPVAFVLLGVYILAKGVDGFLDGDAKVHHSVLPIRIVGLSALVLGTTVWLRIVRLTRTWGWFALGMLLYIAGAGLFFWSAQHFAGRPGPDELTWFEAPLGGTVAMPGVAGAGASGAFILLILAINTRIGRRRVSGVVPNTESDTLGELAANPVAQIPLSRRSHPRAAKRPLRQMIWIAGAGLVTLALLNVRHATDANGPLWKVLVAIVAFLYLWWLAALVFDLVFIWHRYIQSDGALRFLRDKVQRSDLSPSGDRDHRRRMATASPSPADANEPVPEENP